MNRYFELSFLMLCLVGCAPGEVVSIPTAVFTATAIHPLPSATAAATETAVSQTVTPSMSPTQPTANATPEWEADFFDGLILGSPRNFEAVSIIKDNAPASLTKYETGLLTHGQWPGYATIDEKVYTVQNGQIIEYSATGQTEIPFERIPQSIFGVVNDWLILSSFPLDWTVQQEVGNLTAVSLTTFETILIHDERPYVTPIVAPDGSKVIYWGDNATFSWRGEGQSEPRPFPLFRSGAISPNGEYVALLLSGEIHIYNLQTDQLVYQEAFANCPGDGFCFPVWHPGNLQVAYGVYITELTPPDALRLISLDGAVQQFDGAAFPAFSPDGEWMAVYRIVHNRPVTAVVNLETGEILNTPFSGIPINWIDYSDK